MAPVSTIRRLPPALRSAIEEKLAQGHTLDEVTQAVRDMGGNVSRSAVGRYKLRLDAVLERSRQTREIAQVLANAAGHGGAAEIVRGNAELLHGILQAAVAAAESGADAISPKDAMMLGSALANIARAEKSALEMGKMQADAATAVVDVDAVKPAMPDLTQLTPDQLLEFVRTLAQAQAALGA